LYCNKTETLQLPYTRANLIILLLRPLKAQKDLNISVKLQCGPPLDRRCIKSCAPSVYTSVVYIRFSRYRSKR